MSYSIHKPIILFFLSLFLTATGYAQSYSYDIQHINVEEGLPNRQVLKVLQDEKGFIWINTPGAISRFDGYSFKTYNASFLNIQEDSYLEMIVTPDGHIWYCEASRPHYNRFGNGILNIEQDTIYSFEDFSNGLIKDENIKAIRPSKLDNKIILLTTDEGKVYEYKENTFRLIYSHPVIGNDFVCEQATDGSYWVLTSQQAIQLKDGSTTTFSIAGDPFGLLYIGENIVLSLATRKDKFQEKYVFFQDNTFKPYQFVSLGNWAIEEKKDFSGYTTVDQLVLYHQKDTVSFNNRQLGEECDNCTLIIKHSLVDQQDNLWLATNNGLIKITPIENHFQVLERGNSIRGIIVQDSLLWIGGYGANHRYSLENLEQAPAVFFKYSNPGAVAHDYCVDGNKRFWVAAEFVLLAFEANGTALDTFIRHKDGITTLFYNKETDRLLVGTNNGMGYFDRQLKKTILYDFPVPSNLLKVKQIYQNHHGIWIVSNQGLFLLDPHTEQLIRHFSIEDGLPTNNINHIHEDSIGIFWMATKSSGLVRWQIAENLFEQYTTNEGLSNNTLYAVYEDEFDNLWLPSNYGLMCFDKNTTDTKMFLPKHGIAQEEFNTFSHYQDKDGNLYFGGLDGVTIFHPKEVLQLNKKPSPLYLEKVSCLKENANQFEDRTKNYLKKEEIVVTPKDRILEVTFSLLDFEGLKSKQYAYKIEQHQNQWIYTNENKISLINLPYGKYKLIIKGRGSTGGWSEEQLVLPLYIQTPFFRTWWFIALVIALVTLSFFLLMKWRFKQLHKAKENLESEVIKRTQKIEQDKQIILSQSEELKQLDKAKTRFFSNLTHEFRTPLTLIIGPAQQALSKANPSNKRNITRILQNATSLLHLVNQLLDLTKLESGNMPLELSHGDIISYSNQLIEQLKPMADNKDQRLSFVVKRESWHTAFDKEKWKKILFNLVSNAIKFTSDKGVIQICMRKTMRDGKELIRLEVKDTGKGIEKTEINNIFKRFYQHDNSNTREQDGFGIGLSLVKELVELQGGEIWITSEVGKGTSFDVTIPVPTTNIPTTQDVEKEQPFLHQDLSTVLTTVTSNRSTEEALKILVIEDNTEMRTFIGAYLKECYYEVEEAYNGEEGLQKAKTQIPDLIIADIMMPKMDGYQLSKALRSNLSTSHIPIILLTAKTNNKDRLEGLETGADAYLTKPFNLEELNLQIRQLITVRQLIVASVSNSPIKRSEKITVEHAFIQELKSYVREHVDETVLNGEVIGRQFGLSRMQLHRKLKALTNQSTSAFINEVRLEKALELMELKQYTISEVAYKTGFSSPDYFSKQFKKKHGIVPSKYQKS